MTISLQGDAAERLQTGMEVGNATELPFFVPKMWVVNGDARLVSVGGALYYGGWAVSADDIKQFQEKYKFPEIPSFLQPGTMVTSDGKNIDIFSARSLIVAPIASRTTWSLQDGTRLREYAPGSRQHAQVIALLANKDATGHYEVMGPIMLTAKGFQAKNLLDSFSAWDKATRSVRGVIAPGVPAWCFYLAVGTFGKERKQLMVGKSSQSAITPIRAYVPDEISSDLVEKLFVGQEAVDMMVYYLEGSAEWLHAYDTNRKNGNVAPTGMDDFPLDPVPPEDSIPF